MHKQVLLLNICLKILNKVSVYFIDKVFCYFESWTQWRTGNGQFKLSHVNPSLCTHITLAFIGLNTDGTIKDLGAGPYSDFANLRSKNPAVKLLISMGGWNEGSETYSMV